MPETYLPAAVATTSELRTITESTGLFFSTRRTFEPLLVVAVDDRKYGLHLTGPKPFRFFKITDELTDSGLWFPNVTFLVDHTSMVRGTLVDEKLGHLFHQFDELSIGVAALADSFDDAVRLSILSGRLQDTTCHVSYSKWKIVVDDGSRRKTLFEADLEQVD